MAFQDKLKELMTEKNMKAVDLARATGLSEAAISDYLKGKKEPRGRQSIAIAKALDVSLDILWETGFQEKGFPARLKEAREAAGLTQQQVADMMGVTCRTYYGYETGKGQPDVEKIKQLANILQTSGDALLETGFGSESDNKFIEATQDEVNIIKTYRLLDARGKAAVIDTLEHESSYIFANKNARSLEEQADEVLFLPVAASSGAQAVIKTTKAKIEADIAKLKPSDEDL